MVLEIEDGKNGKEIRVHQRVKNGGGQLHWVWQLCFNSKGISIWHDNNFEISHHGSNTVSITDTERE